LSPALEGSPEKRGRIMADVYCAVCGEPFDAQEVYGWDEETEYSWFVTGVGCPCCHWGVEKHRPLRAMLARLALEHGDGDLDDFAGDCSIL